MACFKFINSVVFKLHFQCSASPGCNAHSNYTSWPHNRHRLKTGWSWDYYSTTLISKDYGDTLQPFCSKGEPLAITLTHLTSNFFCFAQHFEVSHSANTTCVKRASSESDVCGNKLHWTTCMNYFLWINYVQFLNAHILNSYVSH